MIKRARRLALPAYIVAFCLIAFPISETTTQLLPLSPTVVRWRFGATGVASTVLLTPMLGLLMVMVIATLAEHVRVLRTATMVSWLVAVVSLVVIGLFVLDTVQLRSTVAEAGRGGFDASAVLALAKWLICMVLAITMARAGGKIGRSDTVKEDTGKIAWKAERPGDAPATPL